MTQFLCVLLQVAGTSGKVQQTADEDAEGISSDAHGAAITEALGMERRNEVAPPLAHCEILSYIEFLSSQLQPTILLEYHSIPECCKICPASCMPMCLDGKQARVSHAFEGCCFSTWPRLCLRSSSQDKL